MLSLWCLWESQVEFGAHESMARRPVGLWLLCTVWGEWRVCQGDGKVGARLVGKKPGTQCFWGRRGQRSVTSESVGTLNTKRFSLDLAAESSCSGGADTED